VALPAAEAPAGSGVSTPGVSAVKSRPASVAKSRRSNRSLTTPAVIAAAACVILLVAILILVVALKGTSKRKDRPIASPAVQNRVPVQRRPSAPNRQRTSVAPPEQNPLADEFRPAVTESPRKVPPVLDTPSEVGDGEPAPAEDDETWTMPQFPKLDLSLTPDDSPPGTASPPAVSDPAPASEPGGEATTASPIDPAQPPPARPVAESSADAEMAAVPAAEDSPAAPLNGAVAEPPPLEPADSATPQITPQPADLAALEAALKEARAAVLARKYDTAIEQLNRLTSVPKKPDQQALCDRLNLLAQYAQNFQSALSEAVADLRAGDEIELAESTVVGGVEVQGDRITFRSQGRNVTRAMDDLPPGLAVAIADRWLDKNDPVSLVVKGAFLVARQNAKESELAKAREWWSEAARAGFDLCDLPKVIDDSYELQAKPSP
jgi:hypothetical protein